MKISLLNPRVTDVTTMPLGILSIAAVLREEGHELKAYDPLTIIDNEKVAKKIAKSNPDVVGISMATAQVSRGLDIAKKIKSILPETNIVFGGVHVTALPMEILKHEYADFVVYGEGEITMKELCNALEKKKPLSKIDGLGFKENRKLKLNNPRKLIEDLDTLPLPARDLLPIEWYTQPPGKIRGLWVNRTLTLMAGRGCPYHCIYCGSHIVFGRKQRYRKVENVIKELEMLVKKYKIDGFWFQDDELTINEKWLEDFCDMLIKSNMNVTWSCQARVNHGTKKLLKKMKESGCAQIDYGVESGSQKVLNNLKKGTTVEQIKNKFKETNDAGIRTGATFIIGNPGETMDDIRETAAVLDEIKPDFADFFFLTPYPGTELYEMTIKNNWMPEIKYSEKWLFTRVIDEPVLSINIPKNELIKARSMLNNMQMKRNYKNYMTSPSYIMNIIKILSKGSPALGRGLSRFYKTGKFESIFYSMFEYYRNHSHRRSLEY